MAYVGDGNNMTNSFLYACAKVGMTFVAATPEDYRPDETVFKNALEDAKETGAELSLVTDPKEAVKDADIVVTDCETCKWQIEMSTSKRCEHPLTVLAQALA